MINNVFNSPEALRVAREGHQLACDDLARTPRHMLDYGNPNHPSHEYIFGYDPIEFMAKQYKESDQ